MASELADFARRVEQITDGAALGRIARAGGMAAKKSALKAAANDLGSDRAMSHFRRKVPLNAGFDELGGSTISVNFRPAGLWLLASQGRRSSGRIRPRKRGGKRAVLTPYGPKAWSSYGSSRGLGTFDDAVRDARLEAPRAAFKQFQSEIGRAVRG